MTKTITTMTTTTSTTISTTIQDKLSNWRTEVRNSIKQSHVGATNNWITHFGIECHQRHEHVVNGNLGKQTSTACLVKN